jgi:hypothetical protein
VVEPLPSKHEALSLDPSFPPKRGRDLSKYKLIVVFSNFLVFQKIVICNKICSYVNRRWLLIVTLQQVNKHILLKFLDLVCNTVSTDLALIHHGCEVTKTQRKRAYHVIAATRGSKKES